MKAQCPKCGTTYHIDDSKIPPNGTFTYCINCKTQFYFKKELSSQEIYPENETKNCNEGWIYILINPVHEKDLLKIGKTKRKPEDRARELSSATGVALPYHIAFDVQVEDCDKAEKIIHERLADYHVNKEFFRLNLKKAIKLVLEIADELEMEVQANTRNIEVASKDNDEDIDILKKELIEIGNSINTLQKHINENSQSDSGLDDLLTLTQLKEQQKKHLDSIKRYNQEREELRKFELDYLNSEKRKEEIAPVLEDLKKYKNIINASTEKEIVKNAWDSLINKYPEAKDLQEGDTLALLCKACGGIVNSIGMALMYIPPGSFMMGSPEEENFRDDFETIHRVVLSKSFYIGLTTVTRAQWYKVMGTKPWNETSSSKIDGDDYPAIEISWFDCQEIIQKLNAREKTEKYRLPTEAEWEYVCRAGSGGSYCFSECHKRSYDPLDEYSWYDENGIGEDDNDMHAVAQKLPNAWGIYDMHGHVNEWCQDSCEVKEIDNNDYIIITDTYKDGVVDPCNSQGDYKVFRGGAWTLDGLFCRSASRHWGEPNQTNFDIGIRIIREV